MEFRAGLVAVCVFVSSGLALRSDFGPSDVVRQVRSFRPGPSALGHGPLAPSDSEFLVDTSITRVAAQYNQTLPDVAFDGAGFLVVWQDDRGGVVSGARVTPEGVVLDPMGILITQAPGERGAPVVDFDGVNFLVVWEENRVGTDWDVIGARVTPQGAVLDPAGIPISTAEDDQWTTAIAFDGTNYLVVWEDDRDDTLFNIYGARVTPQGMVLDSAGIPISIAENDQLTPAVAFDGAGFFVAWEDYRTGVSDIYGARVTAHGTVLDLDGIPVSTATNVQLFPALASDGQNVLTTWGDFRSVSSFDIYAARVTSDGTLLDPAGFVISQAANDQSFPDVGFDGENFVVVWGDYRSGSDYDIYGARVTPGGTVFDPAGFVISQAARDQYYPAMSFDGANFILAWQDDRVGSGYDIYGARLMPQGGVLDSAGFLVSQSANDQSYPAAGFDGENFLVVWADDRQGSGWDIYGARVTPDGEVLDPAGFVISDAARDQRLPAAGFDGRNFIVVWEDFRSDPAGDIYGARVTPGGEVLDPAGLVISQAANDQSLPAVAFDGTNSLVVWADARDGIRFHIYGARVTPGGTVLDQAGIAITTVPGVQYAPAIASNGTNLLVLWQDTRSGTDWDIYGTRMTPEGTLLDPAGIAVARQERNQRFPSAAFDGTGFFVVWQDNRYANDYDIFGARLSPAGDVLDPSGIPIAAAPDEQMLPAIGSDGTNWLAVWEDYRNGIDFDIYGARVSRQGVVFDSGPVVGREQDQTLPRLSVGSGRMLLVYRGWAGNVGRKDYNSNRVWGRVDPRPSKRRAVIASGSAPSRGATIFRGALFLPPAFFSSPSFLLSVDGRKVLELLPGANDLTTLASGIYFLCHTSSAKGGASTVTKVVVQH